MARKSGFVKQMMADSWSNKRSKDFLYCEVYSFFCQHKLNLIRVIMDPHSRFELVINFKITS